MEATVTRASTVIRSIPTSETRTHASMTIPLSRTRSSTSMTLLPTDPLSTGTMRSSPHQARTRNISTHATLACALSRAHMPAGAAGWKEHYQSFGASIAGERGLEKKDAETLAEERMLMQKAAPRKG